MERNNRTGRQQGNCCQGYQRLPTRGAQIWISIFNWAVGWRAHKGQPFGLTEIVM
jgi:hypothetical protein